jgi:hypothetical protein
MPLQRKLRWLLIGALLPLAIAMICPPRAQGQAASTIYLSPPEIGEFPLLSAYLDVIDAQGNFVTGLTPSDLTILEDDIQLPLTGLQAQRPGVQFVLAITPGTALEIRDGQGRSRYQRLIEGMLSGVWDEQEAGLDDFSLLTSEGAILIHNSNPAELSGLLAVYQPPAQGAQPTLETLAQALEVAADPLPRPGMERAVLLVTPPQVADVTAGLQTLAARANQQNIHIYVWLVAAPEYFDLSEANQLASLTAQTGGSFFAFSGTEAVPDLETYLEPLRPSYRLVYESRVASAGAHQFSAQLNLPEGLLVSAPQTFEVNLQPPDPTLITPPVVISRSFAPSATAAELSTTDLIPLEQTLTIAVVFPDGYPRPLVHSTLIVDEMVITENTAPPFDTIRWDLRAYTQDGLHTLRVEVIDSLGLIGQSPESVVQITVPTPEQGVIVAFERQRLLLVGLGVLIAGSVLALVLIIGGRIRPQAGGRSRKVSQHKAARQRLEKDPVTQPVAIPPADKLAGHARSPFSGWLERLPRRTQPTAPQPLAFLTPLAETGAPVLPPPLPLGAEPVNLGSDPQQATLLINDPSVDKLHASLTPHNDSFLIIDAGSTAGTWVNYTRIPPEGVILEHGDLVHLGRSGFRFTLQTNGSRRKPTVQPLEPPV